MDRFSGLNVGRLDSISGVGQSNGVKAPSLASFLSQRANQVLGARHSNETLVVANESAPVAPQESASANPVLARQMDQLQRLHSSISLPTNHQGISVLV